MSNHWRRPDPPDPRYKQIAMAMVIVFCCGLAWIVLALLCGVWS